MCTDTYQQALVLWSAEPGASTESFLGAHGLKLQVLNQATSRELRFLSEVS